MASRLSLVAIGYTGELARCIVEGILYDGLQGGAEVLGVWNSTTPLFKRTALALVALPGNRYPAWEGGDDK